MAITALPRRKPFKDNPAFSLYRKFLGNIKATRISGKRTEKRSMIALNEENLKKQMGVRKNRKTANAEAKEDKDATMRFLVRMLREEGEESPEEDDVESASQQRM